MLDERLTHSTNERKKSVTGIQRAIDKAGSQAIVADGLGISQQAIAKFVKQGYFPIDRAIQVSTLWQIPFADLVRPDIAEAIAKTY